MEKLLAKDGRKGEEREKSFFQQKWKTLSNTFSSWSLWSNIGNDTLLYTIWKLSIGKYVTAVINMWIKYGCFNLEHACSIWAVDTPLELVVKTFKCYVPEIWAQNFAKIVVLKFLRKTFGHITNDMQWSTTRDYFLYVKMSPDTECKTPYCLQPEFQFSISQETSSSNGLLKFVAKVIIDR